MAVTPVFTSWSSSATAVTHTPTLPSSRAGKRYLAYVTYFLNGGTISSASAAWTGVGSLCVAGAVNARWYYRDCDGTSADNLSITLSATAWMRVVWIELPAGSYVSGTAPVSAVAAGATGTTANPDPPAFSSAPFTAGDDVLFFAAAFYASAVATLSSYPSGYTSGTAQAPSSNFVGCGIGYREVAATLAENPGTFTVSASTSWNAQTLAVKIAKPAITVSPPLFTNANSFGTPDNASVAPDVLAAAPLTQQDTSSVTAHVINLPTPRVPGQRVVVIGAHPSSSITTTWPSGWTRSDNSTGNASQSAGYRDVQAGDPDSITVTTSSACRSAFAVFLLPVGAYSSRSLNFRLIDVPSGTAATASIDPQSTNVPWNAANNQGGGTYWFQIIAFKGQAAPPAISNFPANFPDANIYLAPLSSTSAGLAVALKRSTNDSEDSDPFVFGSAWPANSYEAGIVAVRATPPVATISVATNIVVTAPLFTNTQTFFAPRVSMPLRQTARFDNQQTFFGGAIPRTFKQTARFDNQQEFFDQAVDVPGAAIKPPLLENEQTFFTHSINFTFAPPLHTNAQVFFGASVGPSAQIVQDVQFFNQQEFYGAAIKLQLRQTARFDNEQEFFGPRVFSGGTISPTLFVNQQQFFSARINRTLKANKFDNQQTFFPTKLNMHFVVGARFDNQQQFFGPAVFVKAPNHVYPPLFVNKQIFPTHSIVFHPRPPSTGGPGAVGPGWWTDSLKDPPGVEKPKKEEEVVWKIREPIMLAHEPPPWNPEVVTPDRAKAIMARRKRMGDLFKHQATTRRVEDQIINVITKLLKE